MEIRGSKITSGIPKIFGKYMSSKWFNKVLSNLWLCNDTPPIHCNRSSMIWPLVKASNKHMEENFNLSWLSCPDELMVACLNERCPNWVCVKRKPHPFGNKYHTISCCLLKSIYKMELVETEKDLPKEGIIQSQNLRAWWVLVICQPSLSLRKKMSMEW